MKDMNVVRRFTRMQGTKDTRKYFLGIEVKDIRTIQSGKKKRKKQIRDNSITLFEYAYLV